MAARAYSAACASLVALIALCLAWELVLAPLRPGGSWLVLKVLPLLAPLMGVLRGSVYTYRWSVMLVLAYLVEGVVRAVTDTGMAAILAASEILLALIFFAASIAYVRATARGKSKISQ